jgi:hypothetical protein
MFFDQRNFGTQAGAHDRGNQAGGACAEYDDVVAPVGRGIYPFRRVHILCKDPIVLIVGQ